MSGSQNVFGKRKLRGKELRIRIRRIGLILRKIIMKRKLLRCFRIINKMNKQEVQMEAVMYLLNKLLLLIKLIFMLLCVMEESWLLIVILFINSYTWKSFIEK